MNEPQQIPEPTEVIPAEPAQPVAATKFQTLLKLTEEQEAAMVDYCIKRMEEIRQEMGIQPDGTVTSNSWAHRRLRNQLTYDNDLKWRETEIGGVFIKSNMTRGTTKRFTREMSAKVSDDMLGTSPFFGAVKRHENDNAEVARGVEEYAQIGIEGSNVPAVLREAQRTALVRNEAVVKVRHKKIKTTFVGKANVYVELPDKPIITATGMMIYEDDDFVPDPNVENLFRLKKDPTFTMTEGQFEIQEFPALQQEIVRYEGLEAHVLDERSFLCPLQIPSIHDADILIHLSDDTVSGMRAVYGDYENFDRYYSGIGISGESQPKQIHGEQYDGSRSALVKKVHKAECYLRLDVNGDGNEEEVLVVIDIEAKKAVFYDYLLNHMHKRPFEVVLGVESVPNRWYGIGIMQMLEDLNIYVDTQFNRINLKDSRESSVTFRDPMAVKEWKTGSSIKFGTDIVYDTEPGYDPKMRPPVWRVNLNEISETGMELMNVAVQDMTTTFGVISAKDASASNLNNSRTATGILNLERTANTATRYTEIAQRDGLEALLAQCVIILLENMPPMATFFSKDGKALHTINRSEARSIEKDIRLFLTRSRSSEMMAANQQALMIAKDYHMMLAQNPNTAKLLRPLYLAQLKSLEVADGDEMLPAVTDEMIAQWQEQQAAQMKAIENQSLRETIAHKDAVPSIQAQMEQQAGMQPATDEERAQWEAMKNQPAERPQPTQPK